MSDASEAFRLLADATRRRLLFQLCDQESADVSEGILVRGGSRSASVHTNQQQIAGRTSSDGQNVELEHHHLPKLQSNGMIEWDRETQTVSRGPAFEEIEPLLHLLKNNSHKLPIGLLS